MRLEGRVENGSKGMARLREGRSEGYYIISGAYLDDTLFHAAMGGHVASLTELLIVIGG